MKWWHASYEANIPISIVPHLMLIKAMKTTNKVIILYKTIASHAMHIKLRDITQYNIQKLVELEAKSSIHKYG